MPTYYFFDSGTAYCIKVQANFPWDAMEAHLGVKDK